MTIHQSRYGGAAEVGRAPTKPPRKDSKKPLLTIAGGTTALGGGIAASSAQSKLKVARYNRDSAKKLSDEAGRLWRNRATPSDPHGIPLRHHHMGVPPHRGGNLPASDKQFGAYLSRQEKETKRTQKVVRNVRNVRTAGLAALAAGLGLAGASAVHNERSRGTIGYRRPANRQEAIRQAGPTSSAEARYRRTNGM